jgi:hypothetical protein
LEGILGATQLHVRDAHWKRSCVHSCKTAASNWGSANPPSLLVQEISEALAKRPVLLDESFGIAGIHPLASEMMVMAVAQ